MLDLGTVRPGSTIRIPFSTFDKDDGSTITMTNYAAADILIYKDGSTTERASTAGFTATTDFDGKTGKHLAIIDLADNTTAGFFNAGSEYLVGIDSVTVDGVAVGAWIARFRIGHVNAWFDTTIASLSSQTSFTLTVGPAEDNALVGSFAIIHDIASAVQCSRVLITAYTGSTKTVTLAAGATFTAAAGDNISIMWPMPLQPTTLGNTLDVSSGGEAGLDWANIGSKTTTNALTGTTIATTQKVDIETIKTQAVTCAAGVTVGAFVGNATAALAVNASGRVDVGLWLGTAPLALSSQQVQAIVPDTQKVDLNTIKTQSVTCAAGITVGAFVGNATAALAVNASGRVDVGLWLGTAPLALSSQQVQAIVPDTQKVDLNTVKTQSVTCAGGVTIPAATLASTTNITAGTITTTTNLTNAPSAGDFTATMKTSIGTAVAASAVASVTGNVGGNVVGSVGSISGVSFPANFSVLSISASTGLVDITQTGANKVWSTTTRVLTAGTNIVLPSNGLSAIDYVTFDNDFNIGVRDNVQLLIDRLGAFSGTGSGTALHYLTAIMKADAVIPGGLNGTYDPATDSLEAIRNNFPAQFSTLTIGAGRILSDANIITVYEDEDAAAALKNFSLAVDNYSQQWADAAGYSQSVYGQMGTLGANVNSVLTRIGAFSGPGGNTILGFFKALMRKDASLPSDIGGTFDPATDSTEAIKDAGVSVDVDEEAIADAVAEQLGSLAGPGASSNELTFTNTTTSQPIADADVWITTDAEGTNTIAGTLQTNSLGKVTFLLDAGTQYYAWLEKDGVNPILGSAFTAT